MKGYKYIVVFLLTALLFGGAWFVSARVNKEKIAHLQDAQDKIATDLLSSETKFDLLQDSSCEVLNASSFQEEINSLADKIAYSEKNLSAPEEILALKKQYSLLEIRDFLLVRRIGVKCNTAPVTILYFYGSKDSCADCARQGYILDALRKEYPNVRIYSFDYSLDLSIIRAMKEVYKIGDVMPTLVIDGVTKSGFQTLEQIKPLLPTPKK